ncbi:hypothetical protein LJ737_11335 [Hymenobacter sp. 15J16-1T3B]|uniref:hypothetical protein n=1 Tax=Hymenobacter sp. 15J16-1T3B TaxID=2886941 RepID=UPI001D1115F0|nr:hypothetical protein [Hymenobacter sp. 15J16-1T3B]MCC3157832.1 hypothetical protein [Hymenobacter sp. 15J16-1T3B]
MNLCWLRPTGLCVLLGFSAAGARAQTFERGYLVLSRGDTLRGEVENAFWSDPPDKIRFRSDAGLRIYSAGQLRAVGLGGGRLLRHELLPLDRTAETDANRLQVGLHLAQHPDSVLADVLVDGPASLLGVTLNNVKHFFVRRPGQEYLEMTERRYLVLRDGARRIADGNNYRGQLLLYFGDCPAAVSVAEAAAFTAAALAEVVETFNRECSSARQPGRRVARERRPPVKLQVGPTLGLRYNTLRFRTTDEPAVERATLNGVDLDGHVHPQIGAYLDLVHPGRRLALHLAVQHAAYGRTVALPSPDGSAQWQGKLSWRGRLTTPQLGLRWLRPLGQQYQLLLGTGAEVPLRWRNREESLQYGDDAAATRLIDNNQRLSTYAVVRPGFGTTLRPYLEAGVHRGRLTFTLTGRCYGRESLFDHMVVSRYIVSGQFTHHNGYDYSGRTYSLGVALGYQLNRNSDQPTPQ